jgi:hypothetical protein
VLGFTRGLLVPEQVCYDKALPTGHAGCDLWQKKCQGLQDACTAGNFNGPPNNGKDLTPMKKVIDVGLIMAMGGGGAVEAPSSTKKAESKTAEQAEATPTAEVSSTIESNPVPPRPPRQVTRMRAHLSLSLRLLSPRPRRPLPPSLLLLHPPTLPHPLDRRSGAPRDGSALL